MTHAIARLLVAYRPTGRVAAPVLLVRTDSQEEDLGWSAFADRVKLVTIPCDHNDLIRAPNIQKLAAVMEDALMLPQSRGSVLS